MEGIIHSTMQLTRKNG